MNSAAKTNKMVGYMMGVCIKNIGIFVAVVIVCNLLGVSLITVSSSNGQTYGNFDFATAGFIFMGFVGVSGFSEDFKLFMQNCFTRKEIFISQTIFFSLTSAIISAISIIMRVISELLTNAIRITSLFNMIYQDNLNIFTEFMITFLMAFLVSTVAYLITILLNRFDKRKVGFGFVLAGVALVAFFTTAPAVLSPELQRGLIEALAFAFGFTDSGIFPINTVITLLITSAVMAFVSNRLLLRLELR